MTSCALALAATFLSAVKCAGMGEGCETVCFGRSEDSGLVPKRMGSKTSVGIGVFLLLVVAAAMAAAVVGVTCVWALRWRWADSTRSRSTVVIRQACGSNLASNCLSFMLVTTMLLIIAISSVKFIEE